ncbi:MAG: pyridoxal-phosphate dependent enzyme, partial [Gemmatimonadales bacterium]
MTELPPTLPAIDAAAARLAPFVRETPVWEWRDDIWQERAGSVVLKLELFQYSGSFKARGALMNMLALTPDQVKRGVTAVSAGNHAAAVSYAARTLGTSAKVVMPRTASPARVALSERLGAEVVLADDVADAFSRVNTIAAA